MLTQCPGCRTVFRITGTILRAAHGQVRCGNCNTQFDAIEHALDEESLKDKVDDQEDNDKTAYMPPRESVAMASKQQVSSDGGDAADFMAAFEEASTNDEQITMEGDRVNPPTNKEPAPDFMAVDDSDESIIEVFNAESADWSEPFELPAELPAKPQPELTNDELFAAQEAAAVMSPASSDEMTRVRHSSFSAVSDDSGVFVQTSEEEIDISRVANHDALNGNDEADVFNESVYMTELDNALRDPTSQSAESEQSPEPQSILERTRLRRWSRKNARKKQKEVVPDVLLDPEHSVAVPSPRTWPVTIGCIALTLLLMFQMIHHYRQSLVRHPAFGHVLKSVYAAFGSNLEPRWDISAYSIKQWGIVSDPQEPGILRVRASVTNNATFAQPYPMLKLTLEDRFGTKIGMRAFKPAEYLPSAANAMRLLESGNAANVDLAIVDPGEEAVGFQFDSCLGNDDSVRCAHE